MNASTLTYLLGCAVRSYLAEDLFLHIHIWRHVEEKQIEERRQNGGFVAVTNEEQRRRMVLDQTILVNSCWLQGDSNGELYAPTRSMMLC